MTNVYTRNVLFHVMVTIPINPIDSQVSIFLKFTLVLLFDCVEIIDIRTSM
jgi:hypothetical protein